jgi:hypothetical protein
MNQSSKACFKVFRVCGWTLAPSYLTREPTATQHEAREPMSPAAIAQQLRTTLRERDEARSVAKQLLPYCRGREGILLGVALHLLQQCPWLKENT